MSTPDQQTHTAVTTSGKATVRDQLFPLLLLLPAGVIFAIGLHYFDQLLDIWLPGTYGNFTFARATIAIYAAYTAIYAIKRQWLTAAGAFILIIPASFIVHGISLLLPH